MRQIQSCSITTAILILQSNRIYTCFIIKLTIPLKWFAFCFAECCILNYILSFWQYSQVQGVDDTIATQRVLYGITYTFTAVCTTPIIGVTIAYGSVVCCLTNYIWQYGQFQGCGCTTTIQLVGIGIALGENLTVPLKSSTVANSLLVVLICTCWQYYQIQGCLVLTTIV